MLLLATSFTLPLLLGALLLVSHNKSNVTLWLRNGSLSGVQIQPEPVAFSRTALLSSRYQGALARTYDANFTGRELMIRLADEWYLRTFRVSPTGILIGPNFSLIDPCYPEEYCLSRHGPDTFRALVEDLRTLQDFCDARGTPFALVLTPNKAAIYPEELPAKWRRCYQPGPRDYDVLLPLLRARGIRYVDGHRITAELKPASTLPVFPAGGVHWGDPAAFATTNALLELLAAQGLNAPPVRNYQTHTSWHPAGQDSDLATLINTVWLLRYPVSVVTVPPQSPVEGVRPDVVFIGGSFLWKITALLAASQRFSELDYYFYYKQSLHSGSDSGMRQVAAPAPAPDFERDIFAADALVLEVNEQTIYLQDHLTAFLHDALAALPDPRVAKAPFHYQNCIVYRWGDTLSFRQGVGNVINVAATRGFSIPTKGSFTEGPLASIEFEVPPAERDVVVEANSGGFTSKEHLPRQTVSVFANGERLGEWSWTRQKPELRQMVIPRELLAGGKLKLEFRVDHPASPAEFGVGSDERKLGMFIESLRMRVASQ